MEYDKLDFRRIVYMAAYEISRENNGKRGYRFFHSGNDLILEPWGMMPERGITTKTLRVTHREIYGDPAFISELKEKLKKLEEVVEADADDINEKEFDAEHDW